MEDKTRTNRQAEADFLLARAFSSQVETPDGSENATVLVHDGLEAIAGRFLAPGSAAHHEDPDVVVARFLCDALILVAARGAREDCDDTLARFEQVEVGRGLFRGEPDVQALPGLDARR